MGNGLNKEPASDAFAGVPASPALLMWSQLHTIATATLSTRPCALAIRSLSPEVMSQPSLDQVQSNLGPDLPAACTSAFTTLTIKHDISICGIMPCPPFAKSRLGASLSRQTNEYKDAHTMKKSSPRIDLLLPLSLVKTPWR